MSRFSPRTSVSVGILPSQAMDKEILLRRAVEVRPILRPAVIRDAAAEDQAFVVVGADVVAAQEPGHRRDLGGGSEGRQEQKHFPPLPPLLRRAPPSRPPPR